MSGETIAAIATPPGRGGVGVVRLSGPEAGAIVAAVTAAPLPAPRQASVRRFLDQDGAPIDSGLLLWFPAPHSFTGEAVAELHGHGSPIALDRLVERLCQLGARLARPGEFSERAFLNGKLDLAQAEAIADLIDSSSRQAASAAVRSLEGDFSRRVSEVAEQLTGLRVWIEASIDFADEAIELLAEGEVAEQLQQLGSAIDQLAGSARQGRLLRDGFRIVLAGQPNVGKSSLLNALAGRERAIVTHLPGTTRDLLHEQIVIDGMPLHVTDTAGLRESDDLVEQEGIRRAREALAGADRVLLLVDDASGVGPAEQALLEQLAQRVPATIVRNKIDTSGSPPGEREGPHGPELYLSAHSGAGLDTLRNHLRRVAGYHGGEGLFSARRRHLDALRRTRAALDDAVLRLTDSPELVAEELRLAQQALGEITGEVTSDALLGEIFSSFCIGK